MMTLQQHPSSKPQAKPLKSILVKDDVFAFDPTDLLPQLPLQKHDDKDDENLADPNIPMVVDTSAPPELPLLKKKPSLTDLAQLCMNDEDLNHVGHSVKENDNDDLLQELADTSYTLSYEGWQDDEGVARGLLLEYPTPDRFYEKLKAMTNKQRLVVYQDRSHEELQQLDAISFTYPNWQVDHKEYVARHVGDCSRFQMGVSCAYLLSKMKKKQLLHQSRASIPELKPLDAAIAAGTFTYDGWQQDVRLAEGYYTDFSQDDKFQAKVLAMHHKQAWYVGSEDINSNTTPTTMKHPILMGLDMIPWNYPKWESDKQDVIRRHIGDCTVLQLGTAATVLRHMQKRQAGYDKSALESVLGGTNGGKAAAATTRRRSSSSTGALNKMVDLVPPSKSSASAANSLCGSSFGNLSDIENDSDDEGYSWPYAGQLIPAGGDASTNNTATENKKMCCVCMEEAPSYAFIPCGHLCLCAGCVDPYQCRQEQQQQQQHKNAAEEEEEEPQLKCPVCRKTALTVTRIFT